MGINTKLVKGENVVLLINNGGIWKPYICSRGLNMSITTDMIETTVSGSGDYKTFEPTVHSFNASADGVIAFYETGSLTLPELEALQLAKTKLLCRYNITTEGGDVYAKECYFYIANSTSTASFDGVATFAISLQGTGGITTVFTPPSPTTGEVFRYPAAGSTAPAVTGSYTWSTGLTGKTPLNVVKDGRGSNDIILSGTPIGNEVLYDTTTGDLTWAVNFEDGETPPYMEYQN